MKIAVTGKGGVGKTTFAAILARLYATEGKSVLAVDADPDSNLGLALGFSEKELSDIKAVSKMEELIAERTGASKENFGAFFKINPKVDDIPERFAREKNGVKLLVMGTVENGGAGCACPQNSMLKRLMSHLVIEKDYIVIMDMEAGLEHLGRGTAGMVDRFIVIIEPGARSIQTYEKVKSLAYDLGVKNVTVVANKLRTQEDEEFLKSRIPKSDFLGFLSYGEDVSAADRQGISPFDTSSHIREEVAQIKWRIEATY